MTLCFRAYHTTEHWSAHHSDCGGSNSELELELIHLVWGQVVETILYGTVDLYRPRKEFIFGGKFSGLIANSIEFVICMFIVSLINANCISHNYEFVGFGREIYVKISAVVSFESCL